MHAYKSNDVLLRQQSSTKTPEAQLLDARRQRKETDDQLQAMMNRIAFLAQEELRLDRDIEAARRRAAEALARQATRDNEIAATAKEVLAVMPAAAPNKPRPRTGRSSLLVSLSPSPDTTNPGTSTSGSPGPAPSTASLRRAPSHPSTSGRSSNEVCTAAPGSGRGSGVSGDGGTVGVSAGSGHTAASPNTTGSGGANGGGPSGPPPRPPSASRSRPPVFAGRAADKVNKLPPVAPPLRSPSPSARPGTASSRPGTASSRPSTASRSRSASSSGSPPGSSAPLRPPSSPLTPHLSQPLPAPPPSNPHNHPLATSSSPSSTATPHGALPSSSPLSPSRSAPSPSKRPSQGSLPGSLSGSQSTHGSSPATLPSELPPQLLPACAGMAAGSMQQLSGPHGAGADVEVDLALGGPTGHSVGRNAMTVIHGAAGNGAELDGEVLEELQGSRTVGGSGGGAGGLQEFATESGRRVVQVKASRRGGEAATVSAGGVGWGLGGRSGGGGGSIAPREARQLQAEMAKKQQIWKVRKTFGLEPTPMNDRSAQVEEVGAGAWQ